MVLVASTAVTFLVDRLSAADGLTLSLRKRLSAELLPPALPDQVPVSAGHYSADLNDRALGAHYPQVLVYCERIDNKFQEKFRRFSGIAVLVVEVRHSADRLQTLEPVTEALVEAVTDVVEQSRGCWSTGLYCSGQYEVKFDAVRTGGKNFIQAARVIVPLDVHMS